MSGLYKTEVILRGADGPQASIAVSRRHDANQDVINIVVERTDLEQILGLNLTRTGTDALVRAIAHLWEDE